MTVPREKSIGRESQDSHITQASLLPFLYLPQFLPCVSPAHFRVWKLSLTAYFQSKCDPLPHSMLSQPQASSNTVFGPLNLNCLWARFEDLGGILGSQQA